METVGADRSGSNLLFCALAVFLLLLPVDIIRAGHTASTAIATKTPRSKVTRFVMPMLKLL